MVKKVEPRLTISDCLKTIDEMALPLGDYVRLGEPWAETHTNLRIESEGYGHDGGYEYYLLGDRQENDVEYAARLTLLSAEKKKKKAIKEARKAGELAELDRLKKKYEKFRGDE